MSPEQLFARMCAHWPALKGDDELAAVRALDWVRYLRRLEPTTAEKVVEELIAGWTENRAPRIGDVQDAARRVAYHEQLGAPPAILASVANPEAVSKLVAAARASVGRVPSRAPSAARDPARSEVHPVFSRNKTIPGLRERAEQTAKRRERMDAAMVTYAEVYEEVADEANGNVYSVPRPEFAADVERWRRFVPEEKP